MKIGFSFRISLTFFWIRFSFVNVIPQFATFSTSLSANPASVLGNVVSKRALASQDTAVTIYRGRNETDFVGRDCSNTELYLTAQERCSKAQGRRSSCCVAYKRYAFFVCTCQSVRVEHLQALSSSDSGFNVMASLLAETPDLGF